MISGRTVCPLCRGSGYEIIYDLTTAHSAEDVPGLVARCRSCPMWFKLLTGDGIPTSYPGECGHDALAQTYLLSTAARALFHEVLSEVHGRSRPPLRLLDIGAAQGTLVEEALRMGFAAEGIDHCEANVQDARARGLEIRHVAAEDLDYEERFDVVTMMDIIEHLLDPLRVLRSAYRALRPGGCLVVYTPNHRGAVVVLAKLLHALGISYPVREIFGRNHVCFFDDRSLPLALETAGFEVQSRRVFPYDPARPGQPISRWTAAGIGAVEWLGRPLHRVFRLLVHARKPEKSRSGAIC